VLADGNYVEKCKLNPRRIGRAIVTTSHNRALHISPKMRSSTSWDGTGLCVHAKRLERGRFAALWRDEGDAPIALTVSELDLFLDGSALVGRMALTPPALPHVSLASDRGR